MLSFQFSALPTKVERLGLSHSPKILSPAPRGKENRTVRDCRTVELSPACLAVEAGDISKAVGVRIVERRGRRVVGKGNQNREV